MPRRVPPIRHSYASTLHLASTTEQKAGRSKARNREKILQIMPLIQLLAFERCLSGQQAARLSSRPSHTSGEKSERPKYIPLNVILSKRSGYQRLNQHLKNMPLEACNVDLADALAGFRLMRSDVVMTVKPILRLASASQQSGSGSLISASRERRRENHLSACASVRRGSTKHI